LFDRLSGRAAPARYRHLDVRHNAIVETFSKTLKSELVWRTVFSTSNDAARAIAGSINGFTNPVRRPSAFDYLRKTQFEKLASG
jgi:putative transposase